MTFDFSRRRLLATLGFASLPATATAALASAPVVKGESAEFLSLARQLDEAHLAFVRANAKRDACRAEFDRLCPPIPDELVGTKEKRLAYAGFLTEEVDIEGNCVHQPDYVGADGKTYAQRDRLVVDPDALRKEIESWDGPPSARAMQCALLVKAEAFRDEVQRLDTLTGIGVAAAERENAQYAFERLGWKLRNVLAQTQAGFAFKARMAVAAGDIPRTALGQFIALSLAVDIMREIGAQA